MKNFFFYLVGCLFTHCAWAAPLTWSPIDINCQVQSRKSEGGVLQPAVLILDHTWENVEIGAGSIDLPAPYENLSLHYANTLTCTDVPDEGDWVCPYTSFHIFVAKNHDMPFWGNSEAYVVTESINAGLELMVQNVIASTEEYFVTYRCSFKFR